VTALQAACIQQPVPGSTVSISGNLFSSIRTNITDPTISLLPNNRNALDSSGLTLGARVGVAVSAIITLLTITGCCIICIGKRRRRSILRQKQRRSGFAEWNNGIQPANTQSSSLPFGRRADPPAPKTIVVQEGDNVSPIQPYSDNSPQNQGDRKPPWAMNSIIEVDSPVNVMPCGEKVYFSPYSSQYTSPVSASEALLINTQEWPGDNKSASATSGRKASWTWERDLKIGPENGDDGIVREQIELQNVVPQPVLLHHPGNGRVAGSPNGGLLRREGSLL
jgi:hypothetical protein